MKLLLVGGFLGAGKTSIIKMLIQWLVNNHQKCVLIENEIGEVGIDDTLLSEGGVEVTQLFGGCVCCQISGSLVAAVRKIRDEMSPDWVIVEMTGLALMDGIRAVFDDFSSEELKIYTVSIVDMSRWKYLLTALAQIFDRQVAGADIVLINKTDVRQPTEETYEVISRKAPNAVISALSESMKTPEALGNELMRCINEYERKKEL